MNFWIASMLYDPGYISHVERISKELAVSLAEWVTYQNGQLNRMENEGNA